MSFVEFSKNFNSFIYRCFSTEKVAGKIRKKSIQNAVNKFGENGDQKTEERETWGF